MFWFWGDFREKYMKTKSFTFTSIDENVVFNGQIK